ncbi:hypothetical protein RB195_003070 [Necator americanus]|uniref:Uncharacterized protein n=1 Tax=Necator americanus TaxID=51031 RepID=A0ABR1DM42_NECAM
MKIRIRCNSKSNVVNGNGYVTEQGRRIKGKAAVSGQEKKKSEKIKHQEEKSSSIGLSCSGGKERPLFPSELRQSRVKDDYPPGQKKNNYSFEVKDGEGHPVLL